MKKLAVILLALMFVVLPVFANGSSEETATKGSKTTAQTNADTDRFGIPHSDDITSWIIEDNPESITGTVRWWMPFKLNAGMGALIEEFNQTYPNIKVELTTYNNNSDGNLSVNTAIMAGEVDVLASFGLSNTDRRCSNGLYIDLTDRCIEEGISLEDNWGSDQYIWDDSIYTFPCGGLSYYVAINMNAWNEAGLGEIPTEWTWDEYMDACRKMTKYNEDGSVAVYGGSDYHSMSYATYEYLSNVGKNCYYSEDGTSSFLEPLVLKQLERECNAELVEKIWFPKATYRADNIQAQQTFCKGQTATTIICNVTRFLADQKNYPTDWITAFAPYPVSEHGQTNYMSGVAPFSNAGICVGCQDEEAAWAFLKWYSTYGVKYLAAAGHQPNWRGTEPGSTVPLIFGSVENAAKIIDIESHNRVVGNTALPSYYENIVVGYNDLAKIHNEYSLYAFNGTMTPLEAMTEAKKRADESIASYN